MSVEHPTVRARFALRFRCANCRQVMCRELISPNLADAPADVEELLESNLLNSQFYPCEICDNPVSTLIGVRPLEDGETFAPPTEPSSPQSAAQRPRGLGVKGELQRRRAGGAFGRA